MKEYLFSWSPFLGRFDHHISNELLIDKVEAGEVLAQCASIMNRIKIVFPMIACIGITLVAMGLCIAGIILAKWHLGLLAVPITIGVNVAVWSSLWIWHAQTKKFIEAISEYLKKRSSQNIQWHFCMPQAGTYARENFAICLQIS